jgi:alpha-ketoglutarate-dependent taurine dioxygenase
MAIQPRGEDMASELRITPISGIIGAEIGGIDLAARPSAERIAELRDALNRYQVLVFRDQKITPQQQRDFAIHFGPLAPGLVNAQDEPAPGITVVNSQFSKQFTETWHTDHTFSECPPMAAMLHAIKVPSIGGDTLWANMEAAYDELSAPMQRFLDGLNCEHSADVLLRRFANAGVKMSATMEERLFVHPLVRVHPETGRKSLFVNGFYTTRIVDLGEAESRAVLDYLRQHIEQNRFQCRVRWEVDTAVLWDERSTLHFAMPDYDEPRILHRLMIEGDKPIAVGELPLAAE